MSQSPAAAFHPASAPDYPPSRQLREPRLARLRFVTRRAYENVPCFRERLDAGGVSPGREERAMLIFRFDRPDAAIGRLRAAGAGVLADAEVYERIAV